MIARNNTPPTDEWVRDVCLVGHGQDCCRYLTMSAAGWSCEKHSNLRSLLDRRVATKTISARGDNCPGRGST